MGFRALIFALIGLAGSGVSLFRPYLGLLLLGVFYFFRPDIWQESITPVKWLTITIFLGYLATYRTQAEPWKGGGWLLLLAAIYVFPTIFAPYSDAASWDRVILIMKILVMVFLIDKLCVTPHLLSMFVGAMILGCLWFVKVCIISWAGSGFGDVRVDVQMGQGGGANYTAWSLVVLVPFLYYKAIRGRSWQRLISLALIPLWLTSVMATGSRGGLLCLGASTAVFLLLLRQFKVLLGVAVGGVLFFTLAPPSYIARMQTITTDPEKMDASSLSRYQNVQVGMDIVSDYPVFGTGLQTFSKVKRRYLPQGYAGGEGQVAHNTYVQIGTEQGLPALAVFLGMNLAAAGFLLRRRRLADPKEDEEWNYLRVGTLSGLVGTWVQMTKGDMAQTDMLWWMYGIAFTLHHIYNRRAAEQQLALRTLPVTMEPVPGKRRPPPRGSRRLQSQSGTPGTNYQSNQR